MYISLRGFFEDKINWKFYNYIKDICLKYEDDGKSLNIEVAILSGKSTYRAVYYYQTGEGESYFAPDNIDYYIDKYKDDGLFYVIGVTFEYDNRDINLDEVYHRISSKCDRCVSGLQYELVVKPK